MISNLTIHYLSAPLFIILLWFGELTYSVGKIWKAYSTAFIIVLGLAVGLAQEFGSPIYEGGVWFNVGMTILINFLMHIVLFGINGFRKHLNAEQGDDVEAAGIKEEPLRSE